MGSGHTVLPFVVLFPLAIPAVVVEGTARAVGFGLLVGSVVYGLFLAFLLTTW